MDRRSSLSQGVVVGAHLQEPKGRVPPPVHATHGHTLMLHECGRHTVAEALRRQAGKLRQEVFDGRRARRVEPVARRPSLSGGRPAGSGYRVDG